MTPENHGLDTAERVCFYEQDFYVLSNFSSFRVRWQGVDFDTSEHAYHWEKFRDHQDAWNAARLDCGASAARPIGSRGLQGCRGLQASPPPRLGRREGRPHARHPKGEGRAARVRPPQAAGDRRPELVENSWRDDYWGWGPNRDGQNMLGKLWMEIRAELRGQQFHTDQGVGREAASTR